MEANKIIVRPLLTEKSYAGIANKVYTFVVAKNAGKIEINQIRAHSLRLSER